jgi:hypothetical protein
LIQDRRLNFYPVKPQERDSVALKTLVDMTGRYASEDVAYSLRAEARGYQPLLDWSVYLDHLYCENAVKPWKVRKSEARSYGYGVKPGECLRLWRLGRDAATISGLLEARNAVLGRWWE